MLRSLIAFLHVVIFSFIFTTDINELKKNEFKAELSAPASIENGNDGIVELKFTVGPVKGFAKLTDNLPEGVIAEAVEMGDATFTFSNGILKIIWLNFPSDKEFSVKYKLKVSEGAPANFDIGGKFSYLKNNEKRSYSVFKKTISTGAALANNTEDTEATQEKIEAYAKVVRKVENLGSDYYRVTLDITKQGIEGFCKIQEHTSFGGKMKEGDLNGAIFSFIKNKGKFVWMALPPEENFTVSYTLDLKNAKDKDVSILRGHFSFLDDNVTKKVDIINEGEEALAENTSNESDSNTETNTDNKEPETTETIAENTLPVVPPTNTNTDNNSDNDNTQNQENQVEEETELEESNTKEIAENTSTTETEGETTNESTPEEEEEEEEEEVTEETTPTETEEIAENTEGNTELENTEEEPEETIEDTPVLETVPEEIAEEVSAGNSEEETEDQTEESVEEPLVAANTPKPNPVVDNSFGVKSGVNYRVQIAAGKNVVDKAYFEKRHNWTNDFVIENHNGWVKYTTGSYQVYKDARDNREMVNQGDHKFDGPFVTAYNEGIRITVQEALMISKQKWYK